MAGFWIIRLVLLLGLGTLTCADASEGLAGLYNKGNLHYRQGDFAEAISAYEEVIGQGLQNGEVYYNLGNAYFKNGSLGRAILSYERALKLMPGDEDVQANLRFANAQKVDKQEEEDPNFLTRVLWALYNLFGVNTLALLCLVFVFGLGGALLGWLFMPLRRVIWIVLLVVFGTGLVSSGSFLAFKIHQRGQDAAIVLAPEVVGRSGPGNDFLQVFVLHEGTKVFVERSEGAWFLVKLPSGVGGWVSRDAVEKI